MKTINKTKYMALPLLLLVIANTAMAKTENFTVFSKKVSFDLPSDWQSINKEIAVPLKLLGPMYENRRPVVLFVPIDMKKDEKLTLDDKAQAEDSYKMGRLAWLQTFNGKSISFLPMNTYSTDNKKIEIHQFGHLYSFDNENFEEKSYYVRCKNQTYHLKSLIQVEHVSQWSAVVKKVIDSFRCE